MFSHDIITTPAQTLFDLEWKACTVRVPNFLDIPARDIFHAWHHCFTDQSESIHLFILVSIQTINNPWPNREMSVGDLLEAACAQSLISYEMIKKPKHRFVVCDLRGFCGFSIPSEFDPDFMKLLPHKMGTICPVWEILPDYWYAAWTQESGNNHTINKLSELVSRSQ